MLILFNLYNVWFMSFFKHLCSLGKLKGVCVLSLYCDLNTQYIQYAEKGKHCQQSQNLLEGLSLDIPCLDS